MQSLFCQHFVRSGGTYANLKFKELELIKTVPTDSQPKQICFHASKKEFYVAAMNDAVDRGKNGLSPGSLQIFSLPKGKLLHREPSHTSVECLVWKDTIFYSDMFRDEIVFFDLKKRQVIRRARIKEPELYEEGRGHFHFMPKFIALTPNNKQLAVSHWLGGISILEIETGKLQMRVPKFCEHPRGLHYNSSGKLIVLCYGVPDGPGKILLLDPEKNYSMIHQILAGGSPRHIVPTGPDRALISNLNSGQIYEFDTLNFKILRQIRVSGQPNTIVLDSDGSHLYISLRGIDQLAVLSLDQWKIVQRYNTGDYPTGMAASPDGKFLIISNFHDASVNLYKIIRSK